MKNNIIVIITLLMFGCVLPMDKHSFGIRTSEGKRCGICYITQEMVCVDSTSNEEKCIMCGKKKECVRSQINKSPVATYQATFSSPVQQPVNSSSANAQPNQ